jgi:hypothetical protein
MFIGVFNIAGNIFGATSAPLPMTYKGQCPCGTEQLELTVDKWEDVTQIYCHCGDCRRWHSAPFVFEIIVPKGPLKITKVRIYIYIDIYC